MFFLFLDIDVPITTACVQMFEPQKAAILLPSATNTSSKHNETKHWGSYTFFFLHVKLFCVYFLQKNKYGKVKTHHRYSVKEGHTLGGVRNQHRARATEHPPPFQVVQFQPLKTIRKKKNCLKRQRRIVSQPGIWPPPDFPEIPKCIIKKKEKHHGREWFHATSRARYTVRGWVGGMTQSFMYAYRALREKWQNMRPI